MAEVVTGLVVAFEVISTAVEGAAVTGWAITRPTLPLKATYSCIGASPHDDSPDSLARYSHTINIINGDLFIFGGQVSPETLAGNEVHILKLSNVGGLGPQYKAVPAVARDGEDIPSARAGHTACVMDDKIVVFGGYKESGAPTKPLDDRGRVWVFDPQTLHWSHLNAASGVFPTRSCHAAIIHEKKLIIHGGYSEDRSQAGSDTWMFDFASRTWTELASLKPSSSPPFMILAAPPHVALINDKLHVVTASSDSGSQVHVLDLSPLDPDSDQPTHLTEREWASMEFRTNPKTPTPEPRQGAGLVSVSTGMGRSYLVFMLGSKVDPQVQGETKTSDAINEAKAQPEFWTNAWALQLPSSEISVAHAKDQTRNKLGLDSHEAEWAEIEILLDAEDEEGGPSKGLGKSHPGPRRDFASTTFNGKNVIIFWGGRDPNGQAQGNGWMIELKT